MPQKSATPTNRHRRHAISHASATTGRRIDRDGIGCRQAKGSDPLPASPRLLRDGAPSLADEGLLNGRIAEEFREGTRECIGKRVDWQTASAIPMPSCFGSLDEL